MFTTDIRSYLLTNYWGTWRFCYIISINHHWHWNFRNRTNNNVNTFQQSWSCANTFGNPFWTLQKSQIEIRFPLKDCHDRMTRPFKARVSLVKANHVCRETIERERRESKQLAFYWSNLTLALILWYRIISDCNETSLIRLLGVGFVATSTVWSSAHSIHKNLTTWNRIFCQSSTTFVH